MNQQTLDGRLHRRAVRNLAPMITSRIDGQAFSFTPRQRLQRVLRAVDRPSKCLGDTPLEMPLDQTEQSLINVRKTTHLLLGGVFPAEGQSSESDPRRPGGLGDHVAARGVPGSGRGRALHAPAQNGSRLRCTATVEQKVPLIGSKIESMIGCQSIERFSATLRFTAEWITEHARLRMCSVSSGLTFRAWDPRRARLSTPPSVSTVSPNGSAG